VIANTEKKNASSRDLTRPLELAVYNVILPCRRFDVSYKVAVLGRVSLTTEFLLRLLKATDGMDETKAAQFFGFDHRDMAFVVSEAESSGYIERENGHLTLTLAGMELFRGEGEMPEIYEVEGRREQFHFDLLSLAPQRFSPLDEHEVHLPDLKDLDAEQVSSASSRVPDSIRKYYYELTSSKDKAAKRSIYSIDDVEAASRFMGLVKFAVRLNPSSSGMIETDLSDWRNDQELEDRTKIVNAVSSFVEGFKVPRTGAEADAFRTLLDVAPEFMKDFTRTDGGMAVDRYLREAATRVGDVRTDRPTIPILGNVTTRTNMEKLRQVMRYARRRNTRPSSILWVKPGVRFWGATVETVKVLELLGKMIESIDGGEDATPALKVCLSAGEPDYYLRKMFDDVAVTTNPVLPQPLEILLVPGLLSVVLVHAPFGSHGFPIPLGLASFDVQAVQRVNEMIRDVIHNYLMPNGMHSKIYYDLDRAVTSIDAEPEVDPKQ
jgi:hypothetical protein